MPPQNWDELKQYGRRRYEETKYTRYEPVFRMLVAAVDVVSSNFDFEKVVPWISLGVLNLHPPDIKPVELQIYGENPDEGYEISTVRRGGEISQVLFHQTGDLYSLPDVIKLMIDKVQRPKK